MFYALVASLAVALCSLVGILLFRNSAAAHKSHRFILPFAVGVFLGIVFLELIPETLAAAPELLGPAAILVGFFGFYFLAYRLSTYHSHDGRQGDHATAAALTAGGTEADARVNARMLLLGDGIHNIADGVIIASSFMLDPALGVVVTVGVILHEVPQEIAEFGFLVASGYSRSRALFFNFLSASSIFFGTILTLLFVSAAEEYIWVLTGIAAGNLLYIASSDLIPELRESHRDHFYKIFGAAILGVALIAGALFVSREYMESRGVEHTYEDEHTDDRVLHT